MYCIVEALVKNERKKCVLLATYRRDVEVPIHRKSWSRNKSIVKHEERKKYLVFVPYQHTIKEVIEIDENELLSMECNLPYGFIQIAAFTSKYIIEDPYCLEYEIIEFCGYEFIARDIYFIGNVINDCQDICLEALYNYDKSLADLRIAADQT